MGNRWSIETIERLITEDPCILNEMPIHKNVKTYEQLKAEADADEQEIAQLPEVKKSRADEIHAHNVSDLSGSIEILEMQLQELNALLRNYGNPKRREYIKFAAALPAMQEQLHESLELLVEYVRVLYERVEPKVEGEPLDWATAQKKRKKQMETISKENPEYYEWLKQSKGV